MSKFTKWGQLFECKTLTGNQRVILGIILNLHNIEEWDFTPLSVLEERSGIGTTALKENISKLTNLGLIEKKPNYNRKKSGKAPNDYIPNYEIIYNLLNSQMVGKRPFKDNEYGQNEYDDNQMVGKRPFKWSENDYSNGRKTTIRIKEEKIEKKKEIYKEKEKRKVITKDTSNLQVLPDNENNNKNLNKMITNNPSNGNPNNNSHCFFDSVSGCDSPKTLQIQASGRHNTNEARPTTAGQNENLNTHRDGQKLKETTEIAHRDVIGAQMDNYPTTTEKTQQEANKWANRKCDNPNDGGHIPIDQLEDIYNGGQTIPKPQSKATATPTDNKIRYISIAEWKETMLNIQTKIETNRKLDQTDLHALLEGSDDPFRVVDTLKTLKMLLRNYVRLACYWRFLDECEITIPTIRSEKQRKYAKDLLSECDKYYDHYNDVFKKAC